MKCLSALAVVLLLGTGDLYADTGMVRGEHVDGEVLVLLETPPNAASASGSACEAALLSSARSVAESIGARAVRTYPAIAAATGRNTVYMKGEGKSTQELLAALEGRPDVLGASPNYISHATATPDDPRYGEMWGMPFIEAPGAWDIATGSRDVVVAVVDTGIRRDHADLAANVVTDVDGQWGMDTINDDRDPADDQGHGTHVAGTIGAAGNNALGVTGVNWTVGLLGVKVLGADGSGPLDKIIEGLEYVLDQRTRGLNVRVVNMSLGGWMPPSYVFVIPYENAVKALSDAGILVVVAAGNEYQDIDHPGGPGSDPKSPGTDYRGLLCYPACFQLANTITVASVKAGGTLSDFSNYSPNYVDLAAPGSSILSTTMDGGYTAGSGTSMAAPHVAGAAALLMDAHPGETASQIKGRILDCATSNAYLLGLVRTGGHLNIRAAIAGVAPEPMPTPEPGPSPVPTPEPTPGPVVAVTGVSVYPESLHLTIGRSDSLTAFISPENATDQELTWTSSNPEVVECSPYESTAVVIARSRGTSVIAATTRDGGFTARCTVTVTEFSSGGGCATGGGTGASAAVLILLAALAPVVTRRSN